MYRETKITNDLSASAFRDAVFLHSVAGHIPGFYNELYEGEDDPSVQPVKDENSINWLIPESREEFASWIDELREFEGVDINFDPGRLGIRQS